MIEHVMKDESVFVCICRVIEVNVTQRSHKIYICHSSLAISKIYYVLHCKYVFTIYCEKGNTKVKRLKTICFPFLHCNNSEHTYFNEWQYSLLSIVDYLLLLICRRTNKSKVLLVCQCTGVPERNQMYLQLIPKTYNYSIKNDES